MKTTKLLLLAGAVLSAGSVYADDAQPTGAAPGAIFSLSKQVATSPTFPYSNGGRIIEDAAAKDAHLDSIWEKWESFQQPAEGTDRWDVLNDLRDLFGDDDAKSTVMSASTEKERIGTLALDPRGQWMLTQIVNGLYNKIHKILQIPNFIEVAKVLYQWREMAKHLNDNSDLFGFTVPTAQNIPTADATGKLQYPKAPNHHLADTVARMLSLKVVDFAGNEVDHPTGLTKAGLDELDRDLDGSVDERGGIFGPWVNAVKDFMAKHGASLYSEYLEQAGNSLERSSSSDVKDDYFSGDRIENLRSAMQLAWAMHPTAIANASANGKMGARYIIARFYNNAGRYNAATLQTVKGLTGMAFAKEAQAQFAKIYPKAFIGEAALYENESVTSVATQYSDKINLYYTL